MADHAGKIAFNNTTVLMSKNVQIDSTAEQGNKIIRSRIGSVKRPMSTINSGLKIKLKGLIKGPQPQPQDNASNNINLFTQEAVLHQELRKKNYNSGEDNIIVSNFELQKH
jgi:hypothetical protein